MASDEPCSLPGKPPAGMHADGGSVDRSPASSCRRRPDARRPRAIAATLPKTRGRSRAGNLGKRMRRPSYQSHFLETRNLFAAVAGLRQ